MRDDAAPNFNSGRADDDIVYKLPLQESFERFALSPRIEDNETGGWRIPGPNRRGCPGAWVCEMTARNANRFSPFAKILMCDLDPTVEINTLDENPLLRGIPTRVSHEDALFGRRPKLDEKLDPWMSSIIDASIHGHEEIRAAGISW